MEALAEVFWCSHCAVGPTSEKTDTVVFIHAVIVCTAEHPELGAGNSQSLHFCFLPLSPVVPRAGQDLPGWSSPATPTVPAGATCRERTARGHQDSQAGWDGQQGALEAPCSQNPILPLC